jgi:hypothetical protein
MALDVIFLENGTERNIRNCKYHLSKFPFAKKLKTTSVGVQAFKEAAKLANTSSFYVVEPEYKITDNFNFKAPEYDNNYVHIFRYNPLRFDKNSDIKEGYNGVFLLNKNILKTETLDLNQIGDGIKFVDTVASRPMPHDIIMLSHNDSLSTVNQEKFEKNFGPVKRIDCSDRVLGHKQAASIAETEMFFVVDYDFEVTVDVFNISLREVEKQYAHVWSYASGKFGGVKLFNKNILLNTENFGDADFIYNYGVETKWMKSIVSKKLSTEFDIIFLSYDEANAEVNWNKLKSRFPRAKRVHRVEGIYNAHKTASDLSATGNFFVVDGDSEILDTFDFETNITDYEEKYVHIWSSRNPVNGLEYGYGGVKLFHKSMFEESSKTIIDMSTLLGSGVVLVDEVASITRFDFNGLQTFRGAFRECSKLASGNIKNQIDDETKSRLETWQTIAAGEFAEDALLGAKLGSEFGIKYHDNPEKLREINNFKWLTKLHREITMNKKEDELLYTKYDKIDTRTIVNLTNLLYDPKIDLPLNEIRDGLSRGQLVSKFWLIDELNNLRHEFKDDLQILVLGGWIGTLSNFMFQHYEGNIKRIVSIDMDRRCARIADLLNIENMVDNWRFKAATGNMMDIDYENTQFTVLEDSNQIQFGIDWNLLINTSCEHLYSVTDWFDKIPAGKMVVVQSNNFFACDQHFNSVESLDAFEVQCKFSKVLFKGVLPFEMYDRYMIIGIK